MCLLRIPGLGVDSCLLALLGSDRSRRLGQRVVAAPGLGEGDDVADRFGLGQQGDDAVPPEGDAPVRRGAELEGVPAGSRTSPGPRPR